eukprot:776957-Prymnesium_polylepis.1
MAAVSELLRELLRRPRRAGAIRHSQCAPQVQLCAVPACERCCDLRASLGLKGGGRGSREGYEDPPTPYRVAFYVSGGFKRKT